MPWMEEGQLYDVDFWLSRHQRNTFFGYKLSRNMKVAPADSNPPVWSLRNVTYSLDSDKSSSSSHSTEIELALDALKLIVDKSKTLYLHVRVAVR